MGTRFQRIACTLAGLFFLGLSIPVFGQTEGTAAPKNPVVDLNDIRVRVQTRSREMTIGRQASRRFERRAQLVKSVAAQEYLNGIAQNLARNSDAEVPITVKIVDSKEINAFSFPGGFLYINSALILAVDEEAEIAAVMAHEIAHVVARDGMKNSRYLGTGSGLDPVVIASPETGIGASELAGYLIPLKFAPSPRETDADQRGIQYLQKAGYDPRALLTFLQKMQAREQTELNTVLAMFLTHPPTAERVRLAEKQIGAGASTDRQKADSSELQKIKALLVRTENQ